MTEFRVTVRTIDDCEYVGPWLKDDLEFLGWEHLLTTIDEDGFDHIKIAIQQLNKDYTRVAYHNTTNIVSVILEKRETDA